jgi:membrane-associated phospholipid phosphatase
MQRSTVVLISLLVAASAPMASAQTVAPQAVDGAPAVATPATPSPFRSIGHDVIGFFSTDTAKIVGVFAIAGLAATPIDKAGVETMGEHVSKGGASIGNLGGGLYMQAAGALATYVVGRTSGNAEVASLGGDMIRAQVLSQIFVQGTKFAVSRQRPDGSNALSFPSGHSASAFATATVFQQHFGWKVGIPAYTFAGFVGASRMASSKHYLSDVLVGAGIGTAAGRTVTLRLRGDDFSVGAAPTQGGAMVTFTRR